MAIDSRNERPLIVDLDSRTITIPDELKYIGVETDNNSEKVWFNVPRYFDEPDVQGNGDLYQKTAQVHFINANGSFGVYDITEVRDNDDGTISLAWLIGRDVTALAGNVKFQLVFVLFDNGDNVYKLSTSPATLVIRPGIHGSDFSISTDSLTYEQLIELIYDGYETLKAVDTETLRNLSASPKGIVTSLDSNDYLSLESGLYLYMPEDNTDEYYGFVVYWDGLRVSDPIVKYLTTTFSTGCIITSHITDGAVTNAKLADNSVSTSRVVNGAITNEKLAENAVTNVKLHNNAITMSKLGNAFYNYSYTDENHHTDTNTYGVVDAVNALMYDVNNENKIGVLSDGSNIYRLTIRRAITDNELTRGSITNLFGINPQLFSDIYNLPDKIIGANIYMVSDDNSVPIPLNYIYTPPATMEDLYNYDVMYLNGIVCENDGIYKIKAEYGEEWTLYGTIIYARKTPEVILM